MVASILALGRVFFAPESRKRDEKKTFERPFRRGGGGGRMRTTRGSSFTYTLQRGDRDCFELACVETTAVS